MSIPTPERSIKAPSDDGTVVQSNTERHDNIADANTAEVGWHLITHTNGTFPQSLTNYQLKAECGNTFNCQHDKVRNQECLCKKLQTGILQYFLHSSLHDIKVTSLTIILLKGFMTPWKMWARVTHIVHSVGFMAAVSLEMWATVTNIVCIVGLMAAGSLEIKHRKRLP